MEFKDLVQMRRSHRKFTEQEIDGDDVKLILRAGLMSPTSKGQRSWQFVVVDDKMDLEKLSDAKDMGGQFLKGAPWLLSCWVTPCRTTAGWRMAPLLPFPCSIRLNRWAWALAGFRCADADSLMAPVQILSSAVYSTFLRICLASAFSPSGTKPTNVSLRTRTN